MKDVETVMVGGGQAGLATAGVCGAWGHEYVVFEHGQRMGNSGRQLWESLGLCTPARLDRLPGVRVSLVPVEVSERGRRCGTTCSDTRANGTCPSGDRVPAGLRQDRPASSRVRREATRASGGGRRPAGLYLCTMSFEYSISSMLLVAAGRDADYIARLQRGTSAPRRGRQAA